MSKLTTAPLLETHSLRLLDKERRHLSHIPLASDGLTTESPTNGHMPVIYIRKRRTFSEQVNNIYW